MSRISFTSDKQEVRQDCMLASLAEIQLTSSTVPETMSVSKSKPVVVGLYGISGCGKTYLQKQLKDELGDKGFDFFEGSKMIDDLVPGGLAAFQRMEEEENIRWRQQAIDKIGKRCADTGQVGVVAGHFMFWPEDQETPSPVYTQKDLETFTHILYLDVPPEIVAQRRLGDVERDRTPTTTYHLRKWQDAEKAQLRPLCRDNGILFLNLSSHLIKPNKISALLLDFQHHTEESNLALAESQLDDVIIPSQNHLETVLVLDADKTLAADDTGFLFWRMVSSSQVDSREECPLSTLFSSPLGYSYAAFRQAACLYEEEADDDLFESICKKVAAMVTVHPEFVSLLQLVAEQKHVGVVVVTCGLRRIWEKVLENEGWSESVILIGGGRISDGIVVTAAVKGAIVARLRNIYGLYVWAFGDSPLDLIMLSKADQAVVVVGEERTRSKSMDTALRSAMDNDGLQARQTLLPSNVVPRLDLATLPPINITDPEFIESVLCHRNRNAGVQVLHATDKTAAKLLMTPMRDANCAGPVLREAHQRVGRYLATEFLADLIGLEGYQIPHVQGHQISGYRLLHERQTTIVALMRGGEPMALGFNDAFPIAMLVHANKPTDIKPHHLHEQVTMILVDSVVNSGKTIIEFVQHIRNLHASIRLVVVAGVVQAQAASGGTLNPPSARYGKLSLVALRISDNKFTGRRTTDTGNRLFNTTHLE